LSADALYALLGEGFARIPDHRQPKPPIPLRDALLSAFAMFSLGTEKGTLLIMAKRNLKPLVSTPEHQKSVMSHSRSPLFRPLDGYLPSS
jgi:hypothetical protein